MNLVASVHFSMPWTPGAPSPSDGRHVTTNAATTWTAIDLPPVAASLSAAETYHQNTQYHRLTVMYFALIHPRVRYRWLWLWSWVLMPLPTAYVHASTATEKEIWTAENLIEGPRLQCP